MAGKVILTAEQIFGHHDISIYLRPTQTSSALGFHSHEFTELAVLFHGSALYSTQFGSQEIRAGDVLVIPAGDMHSYSEESEVELMNVTFQFDKLPVPYRELIRHPGFAALFRKIRLSSNENHLCERGAPYHALQSGWHCVFRYADAGDQRERTGGAYSRSPVLPVPKSSRSPHRIQRFEPRKFRCGIPLKPVTLETPEFRSAEIDMAAAQEQKFCRMSLMRAGIASATLITGAVPIMKRRLHTSSNLRYLSPVVATSVPPVSACLRRISRLILPA